MKHSLFELVTHTIRFKYSLPNPSINAPRACLSTKDDECYHTGNQHSLSTIIYNSIVDYSFAQFDLPKTTPQNQLQIALQSRLRFDLDSNNPNRMKYGFYGETLLYAILCAIYKADPIISRGYFYNPLTKSETTGYDSYHLVDNRGVVELWFGEVKFHEDYRTGIKSVLKNIQNALSNTYLQTNILAMANHKNNFNTASSSIQNIIAAWESDPQIRIVDEMQKYNMHLIYPIAILSDYVKEEFDETIKTFVQYVNSLPPSSSFDCAIPYSVFFIWAPVENTQSIKETVLTWIDSQEPLI